MFSKIGFVVEGPSDKAVIDKVLEKLEKLNLPSREIKVAKGGKIKNKNKLKSHYFYLKIRGCQRVLVLIDSHCNPSDIRNEFEEYIANIGGKLFVVEHAIESWLLADVNAISIVLGKEIRKKIPNINERHKPEEILNDIFKEYAGRDYEENKDAGKIALYTKFFAVTGPVS